MNTRTRTRTKVETKEEEITEVECINCEDYYVEDEILPLSINEDFDRNICKFCAESMYDYQTETSLEPNLYKALDDINFSKIWSKITITVGFIIASMTVAGLSINAFAGVFQGTELEGSIIPIIMPMVFTFYVCMAMLDNDIP